MATERMEMAAPSWFRLSTVARSHGWFDLPPFQWSAKDNRLIAAAWIGGMPTDLAISQPSKKSLVVEMARAGRRSGDTRDSARRATRAMLGLDLEFAEFYRAAGPDFEWAKRIGAGPFLRAGSAYEDAVKMLATTNCGWSATRRMVSRLVDELGGRTPSGHRAFPTAAAMASKDSAYYQDVIRTGYRAPAFVEFAKSVAMGGVDPEAWPKWPGPTKELIAEIVRQRGFGRYSAENLCKLFGRFDGLGLDSWCLKKFSVLNPGVRGDVAKAIKRRYERHGRWRGLALWLDLTRDWHQRANERDATTSFSDVP